MDQELLHYQKGEEELEETPSVIGRSFDDEVCAVILPLAASDWMNAEDFDLHS